MKRSSFSVRRYLKVLLAFLVPLVAIGRAQAPNPDVTLVRGDVGFTAWHVSLSLPEYAALKKIAADRKMPLFDLLNAVYFESILAALKAHGDLSHATPQMIEKEADPILLQKLKALLN